jgi:signal peptidase I
MKFNLEFILVGGGLLFGLVLLYYFFFGNKYQQEGEKMPILQDFAKTFFPLILIILVLRSFIAEPFRIPSGSMIPTLEVGDFVLVKKYVYGLRLPIIQTKIIDTGKPKRGDVVVFRYPPQPEINYIKRVIGLPGDHIEWTDTRKLIINGKLVEVQASDEYYYKDTTGASQIALQGTEFLTVDQPHQFIAFSKTTKSGEWDVPKGHYFMMGDNRYKSSDSRFWGFVPEENLVGKASLVWMHWNWLDSGDGFQAKRVGVTVN